ncbi:MAG: glycerol kinase [Clostridiales Family XIII bacterium]|jgi:glycerol kinase|nr:glycerol kinase [Clostridiales Family XIII bacterium]
MRDHILVIDEGTTGTRAVIFDRSFRAVSRSYRALGLHTTPPDKIEQDFDEIYEKSVEVCRRAMDEAGLRAEDILCIGIANQRNTVCLWDKNTGRPIRRGVVWKDTRTSELLSKELEREYSELGPKRCGRQFVTSSATILLQWLMDNEADTRAALLSGNVIYGTVDSWLVWKLTGGAMHAISYSNASSLNVYDNIDDDWCAPIFEASGVPMNIMPRLKAEAGDYGVTKVFGAPIPITGVIGDQQASLFAHGCREAGDVKCTNGTGTFMDVNIGENYAEPNTGLATMVAWEIAGRRSYLFEGMLPGAGSAVQWLRDGLGLIGNYSDAHDLAVSVPDSGGVYFVVTLAGAFAPRYDPYARGAVFGLSHDTTKAHLVRATLEGIAFGVADIMDIIEKNTGLRIRGIRIDGGASRNDLLAQSFADFIRCDVSRAADFDMTTALGAARIAAVGAGAESVETLPESQVYDRLFRPSISEEDRLLKLSRYRNAVGRSGEWLKQP